MNLHSEAFDSLIKHLLLSACLGALIGLERQWESARHFEAEKIRVGLRTFALWSVLGTISAYVTSSFVPHFYLFSFVGIVGIIGVGYYREGRMGFTTMTVAMLTFLIGSLVYWEQILLAITLTIVVLFLLASKQWIHRLTLHLTQQDVHSAVQFAALTGIILPIVPNQSFGPFEAFNPFQTWLMVILVSGLGFLGYAAMRVMGPHAGITLTGIFGGIASSTATTLAFSRKSLNRPELSQQLALGITLACNVMLIRIALIILPLNYEVFFQLLLPLAILALPGFILGGFWWWQSKPKQNTDSQPMLHNPLSLRISIQFALVYSVIVFLGKLVIHFSGTSAIYWLSFFSGLVQMDAIILSLLGMVSDATTSTQNQTLLISTDLASKAIIVAIIANTVLKAACAAHFGSPQLRRQVVTVLTWTAFCGVLAWMLMYLKM